MNTEPMKLRIGSDYLFRGQTVKLMGYQDSNDPDMAAGSFCVCRRESDCSPLFLKMFELSDLSTRDSSKSRKA